MRKDLSLDQSMGYNNGKVGNGRNRFEECDEKDVTLCKTAKAAILNYHQPINSAFDQLGIFDIFLHLPQLALLDHCAVCNQSVGLG